MIYSFYFIILSNVCSFSIQLKLFCKFENRFVVLHLSTLSQNNHLVQSDTHNSSQIELRISYIEILFFSIHSFTHHALHFIVIIIHDFSKSEIILLSRDSDIAKSFDKSLIFSNLSSFSATYITAFRAYHHFFETLSISTI